MTNDSLHPAIADAKAVLFDFDFTLADSSVGIIACMNYALDKIGLPHRPDADILATVGLYIPDALVEMEGEKYRPRGMEFMSYFTEKADEVMMDGTYLYDGSAHTLRTLQSSGLVIGVVSTKYRYRIEAILDREGLLDRVSSIVGGEDVERHKPHPEGLITMASRLNLAIPDCVYVGDSEVDARAAQSADMPFIGVSSGTTTADALGKYPSRAILDGVNQLTSKGRS